MINLLLHRIQPLMLTLFLVPLPSFAFTPISDNTAPAQDKSRSQLVSIMSNNKKVQDLIQFEVVDQNSLKIIDGANPYIGFHISETNKKVNKGVRSEISIDYPFGPGDIIRYEWRFMMPQDFKSDAPKNRWWTLAQWHDQPDLNKNETWQDLPSRSPPVAIYYGALHGNDFMSVAYLNFKPTEQELIPITKGQWMKVKVEIKWSRNQNGYAKVFVNEQAQPVFSKNGPNMHNDYQHYFKLGMYRDPGIKTDNTLYVDDVNVIEMPANP